MCSDTYISKAIFLDGDDIPNHGKGDRGKHFSGKRVKRGLYRTSCHLLINADVNGAANILKKGLSQLTKETDFNIETVNVWNPQTVII